MKFIGLSKDENPKLDYDYKNEDWLYKDDIIRRVTTDLEQRKEERAPLELVWRLISNYINGNQYCDIDPETMQIEDIEAPFDYLQRETYNRLAPIYEARLSKLSNIRPSMRCRPATNEIDDIAKAKTSTAILKGTQVKVNFFNILDTANSWMDLLGTVFFYNGWNTSGGKLLHMEETLTIGDDGKIDKQVNSIYEGELSFGILTPFEVYPDSLQNQEITDCRSIIIEQVMSVDKIYDLYGIRVDGREISTYGVSPTSVTGGLGYKSTVNTLSIQTRKDSEVVITKMELPSRDYPDGRMTIVVGKSELVYYGELPYKVGECGKKCYPLVKLVAIKKAGSFFGTTVYERMLPVQRAYNAVKNRKHDYLNRAVIGAHTYEKGSIDEDRLLEEGIAPGSLHPRTPGSEPPEPIKNGEFPNVFVNEEQNLLRELEYLSGMSEMAMISATPSGLRSGKALESIKESDDMRISRTGEMIRSAALEVSRQWLRLYKQFAVAPRILSFTGKNEIANVFWWCSSDVTSDDIIHETENELNDSLENRRQFVLQLLNIGAFNDENGVMDRRAKAKMFELFKFGNWEDAIDIDELHIARSQRENAYFQAGILPQIEPYDNHEMHGQEHDRLILSQEFEVLKQKKPELAQMFIAHRMEHEAILEQRAIQAQEQQIMAMKNMGQKQWVKNMKQNPVSKGD